LICGHDHSGFGFQQVGETLCINPGAICRLTAGEYVVKNGLDASDFDIEVNEDEKTISVRANSSVSLFFAKIWDIDEGEVSGRSRARVEGITSVTGVAPLGIEEQKLEKGRLYTLKVAAPPPTGGGNFGALSLGGPGADRYRENLKWGYDQPISVGDVLDTETGNMSGPTKDAIDSRMKGCSHVPRCTIEQYERSCPRIIIVPVYRPYLQQGAQLKKVEVVGFASFLIDGETGSGNESYVRGYFIDQVFSGETSPSQSGYGAFGVKLIQ